MATKRVGILMGGSDVHGLISVIMSAGRGGKQIDCEADRSGAARRSS